MPKVVIIGELTVITPISYVQFILATIESFIILKYSKIIIIIIIIHPMKNTVVWFISIFITL